MDLSINMSLPVACIFACGMLLIAAGVVALAVLIIKEM